MRAIAFNDFGGTEVLKQMEFADPVPGANEVVIRLNSTSINMLDILTRKGYMKQLTPLPHVAGADVCGKIEKIGSSVKEFSVGEMVVANSFIACKSCTACLSNNEGMCYNWKIVGRDIWGSYGELVKLPASLLVAAPSQFNSQELGCIPLSLSTSWKCIKLAEARQGDTVVIRGASGNVGIFATMLAKALGLKVIALTRSQDKLKRLEALHADLVIDTRIENSDPVKQIKDFTNGSGADFLLEPLGATVEQSIDMVHNGGRIILFGTAAGSVASMDVKKLYFGFKHIIGNVASSKADFEEALKFIVQNNIKPIIGKTLSIKQAADAQQMLESSQIFGKIALIHDW